MASKNPFASDTTFHLKLFRVLFEGGPLMLKDLVEAELTEQTGEDWNDGELWKDWCLENEDHVKAFQFLKNMKTEDFKGSKVPNLDDSDVTFLNYVLKKFARKKDPIDKLTKKRNKFAHENIKAMRALDFVTFFSELIIICRNMFQDHFELREKWEEYLTNILIEEAYGEKAEDFYKAKRELFVKSLGDFIGQFNASFLSNENWSLSLKDATPPMKSAKGVKDLADVSSAFKMEMKKQTKNFYIPGTLQELDISKNYIDVGLDEKNKATSSSTSPSTTSSTSDLKPGYSINNLISDMEKHNPFKMTISANGGYGKTMVANKIVNKWANEECLASYPLVFHLDMGKINFDLSLHDNLMIQHACLKNYNDLRECLSKNASQILWILDGIEYCVRNAPAKQFFSNLLSPTSDFYNSSFIFLTRLDGDNLLRNVVEDAQEFTIAPLTKELRCDFIKRFEFCDDEGFKAEEKRKEMETKCETHAWIEDLISIPVFLVMTCEIFDNNQGKDVLELLLGVIAMTLKMESSSQGLDIENMSTMDITSFIRENVFILTVLGDILLRHNFIVDENSFYDDLKEKPLTPEQKSLIIRLPFLQQKVIQTRKKLCSNFVVFNEKLEELLAAIFILRNHDLLSTNVVWSEIGQKQIDILRCALILYSKNILCYGIERLKSKIKVIVEFFFQSSKTVTQWRCLQIISQAIKISIEKPFFEQTVFEMFNLIKKYHFSDDLSFLQFHLNLEQMKNHKTKNCSECILPKLLAEQLVKLGINEDAEMSRQCWPFPEMFYIPKLFYISDKVIFFCLHSEDKSEDHVVENSKFFCIGAKEASVKSPSSLAKLSDPLPVEVIQTSPMEPYYNFFQYKFRGISIIFALFFQGKIYILGVYQNESFGPVNIFSMDPISGSWERIKETGFVQSSTYYAAGVATESEIFIFSNNTLDSGLPNELYSLDSTRKFTKISPKGEVSSPRKGHRGWEYKGKVYFIGGQKDKPSDSPTRVDEDGQWESVVHSYYTNELLQFDPAKSSFSVPVTKGKQPPPRSRFALARLREKVFLHGGYGDNGRLNDFFMLNMDSLAWIELLSFGLSTRISNHALTPISSTELLVVGGEKANGNLSNIVKIYDALNSSWKDEPNLPEDIFQSTKLRTHDVVSVQVKNRIVSVYCFGGAILLNFPTRILKFNMRIETTK